MESNSINISQHKELFEIAISSSGIGVWMYDVSSNEVYWSEKVFEIFEINKKGFNPDFETYINLVHQDDRALFKSNLSKVMDDDGELEFKIQHRILIDNNSKKWVECTGKKVLEAGKTRLIGTIRDISELKETKNKADLYQEEIESQNKLLKDFAYVTSHNLRAPIGNIVMLLELFSKSKDQEEKEEIIDTLINSSNTVFETVNKLALDLKHIKK